MKPQKQNKKFVSYYDTKDEFEYAGNEKNLKKIRSKNLRQFCKFYYDMQIVPVLLSFENNNDPRKVLKLFQTKKGAEVILSQIKQKDMDKKKVKILKQFEKNHDTRIRWISKRSLYDYMNAYKYINACKYLSNNLIVGITEGIPKIKELMRMEPLK